MVSGPRRRSNKRVHQIDSLGWHGDKEDLPELLEALADSDRHVRRAAAKSLGRIGDESATAQLIVALEDEDRSVRMAAIHSLGWIGHADAIPGLAHVLSHEPDSEIRLVASMALGWIKESETIPVLINTLADEDRNVRRVAAGILVDYKETAVTYLLDAMHSPDRSLRWAAAGVLKNIGDVALPGLLGSLCDEHNAVSLAASRVIPEFGDAAIPGLIDVLVTTSSVECRDITRKILATMGEAAAPDLLAILSDDTHPLEAKRAAAWALAAIGGEVIVRELHQLLYADDESLRKIVAEALSRIGATSISSLLEEIRLANSMTRDVFIPILDSLGDTAISELGDVLEAGDRPFAVSAAWALGNIGGEEARDNLLNALSHPDWLIRWSAVKALSNIQDSSIVPYLLQSLHDNDNGVRIEAARTLAALGKPAIPGLLEALRSTSNAARWAAAIGLAEIHEDHVPALLTAWRDATPEVRQALARAINKVQSIHGASSVHAQLLQEAALIFDTSQESTT